MEIYYQGTDITGMVQTRKCIVRDCAGKRCDSLELEFENAAGWYLWSPQEDDQIIVAHNGYDSGTMYVNTVLPTDGKYRIFATALPCRARRRGNGSFVGQTIEAIISSCALPDGMEPRLYGLDGNITVPYAERVNEWHAAFLERFLEQEGALLKCINGRYTAIGIEYAQDLDPWQEIELLADRGGAQYLREGTRTRTLTIRTPYAEATAEDTDAPETGERLIVNDVPAMNSVQAGRRARAALLLRNRECELVTMHSTFNPGFSALIRINITGNTGTNGEWLVEEAEHDLVNEKTTVHLRRCIRTIR